MNSNNSKIKNSSTKKMIVIVASICLVLGALLGILLNSMYFKIGFSSPLNPTITENSVSSSINTTVPKRALNIGDLLGSDYKIIGAYPANPGSQSEIMYVEILEISSGSIFKTSTIGNYGVGLNVIGQSLPTTTPINPFSVNLYGQFYNFVIYGTNQDFYLYLIPTVSTLDNSSIGTSTTPQTGAALSLDTASINPKVTANVVAVIAYIRNIGQVSFTANKVYVNGLQLDSGKWMFNSGAALAKDSVGMLTIQQGVSGSPNYFQPSVTYQIKIVGVDNTQLSFNVKS